jgi:ribosomal-protein-alanine N-acetyltransferase
MGTQFKFRNAEISDVWDLYQIEQVCFQQGIREDSEVLAERIRVFPKGVIIAEASDGEKPVGYVSAELWRESEGIMGEKFKAWRSTQESHRIDGEQLYISSIGVAPKYRGMGLGEALLNEVIHRVMLQCPQVRTGCLIVSVNWIAARKLYKKCGFRDVCSIEGMYEPEGLAPETGVGMVRKLK